MDGSFLSLTLAPDGRRLFSHADMARMVEAGLIGPDERWELIRGEWYAMPSEGFAHMTLRDLLFREVVLQLGRRRDVRVTSEGSILLGPDTEVRPDLAIYRADVGTNAMSGDDLLLVVEIMKSSRVRDLERKRPVYAAAGVAEAWFIDMDADTLLVCRDPDRAAEIYRTQVLLGPDEAVSPLRFAGVSLSLNGLRQG
jgi:hypothetical protein